MLFVLSRAPVRISPASHQIPSVLGLVTRTLCQSHCSGTKASCNSQSPSLIWCHSTTNFLGTSLLTVHKEACPSFSTMPPMYERGRAIPGLRVGEEDFVQLRRAGKHLSSCGAWAVLSSQYLDEGWVNSPPLADLGSVFPCPGSVAAPFW